MKIVRAIVEAIYWVNIFIVPLVFLGVLGYVVNYHVHNTLSFIFFIVCLVSGALLGIIWAERVRKKVGCVNYINRIFETNDVKETE